VKPLTTASPDLAAVALTAYARSTDRARALEAGFQQHVIKPVDPKDLLEWIRSLV
jgi:CheY-like chemotaxis protein